MLLDLIRPTAGRATLFGLDSRKEGVVARGRIGYLPENPYFYDYLTAEELLMYFGALFGYDAAERRRRAGRLLDQVGIAGERRLQLRKFSKGMVQRVGIAQALLNDPDLVIFDEPMSGLAPVIVENVLASLTRINATTNTAIVIVEQNVKATLPAVERAVILKSGRLVWDGASSDLARKEDLWTWF